MLTVRSLSDTLDGLSTIGRVDGYLGSLAHTLGFGLTEHDVVGQQVVLLGSTVVGVREDALSITSGCLFLTTAQVASRCLGTSVKLLLEL
jgi:hypothetical protein